MSKEVLRESVLRETAKYLVGAILGVLGTLGLSVWQQTGPPVLAAIEQSATKSLLLRSSLLLGLAVVLSWVLFWLFYRRPPTPLTKKFPFEPYGGYYIDTSSGHSLCPRCLAEGSVVHMMHAKNNQGEVFICNACNATCRGKEPNH